jgi:hypothetical protein
MIIKKGIMKTRKKVEKFKEMITKKGMTKIKKKMITMEGDKQDLEKGKIVQELYH